MARDLSSERLKRLKDLVALFDRKSGYPKGELMSRMGYRCARTMERDLNCCGRAWGWTSVSTVPQGATSWPA
ncbi:MAG: hypothetical protein N2315_01435 [Thermanaerothrix sp.]|nr:hypothetical protein [Thermanaerothrix sp.]